MPRRTLIALAILAGLAACTDASRLPSAVDVTPAAERGGSDPIPSADRVTAAALWNQRTRAIIGRRGGSSNVAARTFALVSVAQYDAVIAAEDAKARGVHPSEAGASAAASAAVLTALYPVEKPFIDARLAEDAAYFPALPSERDADFDAGAAVGREVAAAVIAYGATDGSKVPWTGTIPAGLGIWVPVSLPPQDANWGAVRPWLLSSADQFRPAPPPDLVSALFLTDLAEVRHISDTRTAEQLRIAKYWATDYGPGGPAGFFGNVAVRLVASQHMDERQASRTFAVLRTAVMDASIGCFEAKYVYWYLRPYQADAAITTPVGRPNFPSYPSAHSCLSSAAAGVLTGIFPTAAYDLQAMVDEAGVARIYAGLHFRFDVTAGQLLGRSVAELALRLAPEGHRAIPLD